MKCSHRLSPNKMPSTHKMSFIIIWIRFMKVSNKILPIWTIKVLNCRNNSTWLKNRWWPKCRRLNKRQQNKSMISISIYCNSNSNNIINNKKQKHQGKDLQLDHLVVVSMQHLVDLAKAERYHTFKSQRKTSPTFTPLLNLDCWPDWRTMYYNKLMINCRTIRSKDNWFKRYKTKTMRTWAATSWYTIQSMASWPT